MELAGIQFAPLSVPMERRLQTLAAGVGFVWLIFGGFICLFLSIYLILFTRFWWITSLYLLWILLWDVNVSERGGRQIQWVRNWRWWKYMKDYFPVTLERVPWVELDPKKNYLFCVFPHGLLSLGVVCSFGNNYGEFKTYFPHHTAHVVTLSQHYVMPFFREMGLALGGISAEARSIQHVLERPEGGHVCVLMPGGAQESYYCKPGQYRIILNRRKGFIKLALKNGTPLVPVLSFGETDTFDQVEGETLKKIQEFIRKWIGIAPVVPVGRGFFQYTFGMVPRRKPIHVVVGSPVDVPKIENPTREQVEEYHGKFVEHLQQMFEEQKFHYLEDPENTKLVIEC
ncbi:2-acylglycerol O-acyltransferase 1-like [Anthonomus grandis grandis]|uniref:2-acylglycerol O-acyltransferase 1-like n=1 Tax=Anthonomus grandis grandis TaxID=2921223 RepID=UPI002165AC96|nr:2-acylglycerol O-acyltransferase 1-like [Anthonomus grandis grandis]XP_050296930.1 2-acylglycerol O-acyltransferase 1-like [Anthonomus grandis grandis]